MSVGEVKVLLRAAIEAARHGGRVFDEASGQAGSATARATVILAGSKNKDVTDALGALAEASAEVRQTRRRFAAAADHAEHYLRRLG